ncbi:uncharacterized protein C8A04DRAFT_33001 [Dichotomopilus funicola]|uniref:F-box domain-containing protein n=1 Tax=Dichotomopilus funicola TaxID=1934379 RepID=A0AAN6UV19_9PEZI|nr:hypothetical protein C8A04DRAFT_33001 [Dichotomopilus funicola]
MDRDALKTSPISASRLPGLLRLTPECRQHIYANLGLSNVRTPDRSRPTVHRPVYDLSDPLDLAQADSSDDDFELSLPTVNGLGDPSSFASHPGSLNEAVKYPFEYPFEYPYTPVPTFYDLSDASSLAHHAGSPHEDFQTFHGLLLSCRTLYAEISALLYSFYSSNRFLLHYHAPSYSLLAPLRTVRPQAVRHLAHLKVVLNQASCHDPYHNSDRECCWDRSLRTPQCVEHGAWYTHDLPLNAANTAVITALAREWNAAAAYLASQLATNPGRLELALVCDVQAGDVDTAQQVVLSSLEPLLPLLKDCHVRLCHKPDPVLQRLALETVARVGWRQQPQPLDSSTSHRYQSKRSLLALPPEIRLRILEYTDLVAPFCELYWSRDTRRLTFNRGRWHGHCPSTLKHGYQFLRCSESALGEQNVGCFCRIRHAAASSLSKSFPSYVCRCWGGPPTALFLVCRTLSDEALRVWYGRNRIIVFDGVDASSPYHPWSVGHDYPHNRFAISEFLRDALPPRCRRYIRTLELAFAPFTHYNRPRGVGHPAFVDWRELVGVWMKRNLNLGGLTLRLVTTQNPEVEGIEGHEIMTTKAQGKEVRDVYTTLLNPLRDLGCPEDSSPSITTATATRSNSTSDPSNQRSAPLARFYADLAWPYVRTGDRWPRREWFDAKDRELRQRSERFVMGNRYDDDAGDGKNCDNSHWFDTLGGGPGRRRSSWMWFLLPGQQ